MRSKRIQRSESERNMQRYSNNADEKDVPTKERSEKVARKREGGSGSETQKQSEELRERKTSEARTKRTGEVRLVLECAQAVLCDDPVPLGWL